MTVEEQEVLKINSGYFTAEVEKNFTNKGVLESVDLVIMRFDVLVITYHARTLFELDTLINLTHSALALDDNDLNKLRAYLGLTEETSLVIYDLVKPLKEEELDEKSKYKNNTDSPYKDYPVGFLTLLEKLNKHIPTYVQGINEAIVRSKNNEDIGKGITGEVKKKKKEKK